MITKEQFCFGILWLGSVVSTQDATGTSLLIGSIIGLVMLVFLVHFTFYDKRDAE